MRDIAIGRREREGGRGKGRGGGGEMDEMNGINWKEGEGKDAGARASEKLVRRMGTKREKKNGISMWRTPCIFQLLIGYHHTLLIRDHIIISEK